MQRILKERQGNIFYKPQGASLNI